MQSGSGHAGAASPAAARLGGALWRRSWLGITALAAIVCAFGVDATAQADTVLYSFCSTANCTDGYSPTADLVATSTKLYGTTLGGGAGYGTVFSVNPNGTGYTLLHTFGSIANDGQSPWSGLVKIGNRLYGTTTYGGQNNSGTVYSVKTNGTGYQVLHSFCGPNYCASGEAPYGGLIDVGGVLYGTTSFGGVVNASCSETCGTVFEIQPSGAGYQVLYSFCSLPGCADGAYPMARLLNVGGTLYGTTAFGGAFGYGTVFSLAPCGSPPCAEAALYFFGANASDGQGPLAGLTYKTVGNVGYLFGTTSAGGASDNGAVFAVLPCGAPPCPRPWFYSFNGGPNDGAMPYADLLAWGGYLYGATIIGGGANLGTAFSIRANGLTGEAVLSSFGNGADGVSPSAGFARIGNELYSTTMWGGANTACSANCGTVYSIP